MSDHLSHLNPPQKEAVVHTEGPLIVLAGAGSGKTKMLTSRIAYLIQQKQVPASQILAMTFTNKAAGEMQHRVASILQAHSGLMFHRPEIGTFHSVCVKILRQCLPYTPFSNNFVIYDDGEQLTLIKDLMKKHGLSEKQSPPKAIQGLINRAKCDGVSPEDFFYSGKSRLLPDPQSFYADYQKALFAQNAIDFGEILCMVYRLWKKNPEVLSSYQNRYRYIHVDEYQDTNKIQYLLLSLLASPHHGGTGNLCVVGDEDQSIYRWRGADIRNILEFEKDYPNARVIKLEQNYRSTQQIISAASQLIAENTQRKPKELWTQNEKGSPLVRWELTDEKEEAERVVAEIQKLVHSKSLTLSDVGIFYRTNAQSRQFEDVLRREKVQYEIYGGLRFYDRKEIKDLIAYLRVLLNPHDSISLKRIFNVPARGLGKTTLESLEEVSLQKESSLWEAIHHALESERLGRSAHLRLQELIQLLKGFQNAQKTLSLRALYHLLLEKTGYLSFLQKEDSEEAQARVENLKEFETLLQEFEIQNPNLPPDQALALFIEQISLESYISPIETPPSSVKLMTLHASKGLEFPVVFLVGLEEGLFPSLRGGWEEGAQDEIEEERRLCYVGMTRAKQFLYLSHVTIRHLWGQASFQRPSRFLKEIPTACFQIPSAVLSFPRKTAKSSSAGTFSSKSLLPKGHLGKTIAHPEYGRGQVIHIEGFGEQEKLTVSFDHLKAPKKFLLKYVQNYLE